MDRMEVAHGPKEQCGQELKREVWQRSNAINTVVGDGND
jgi:hypothetical protein